MKLDQQPQVMTLASELKLDWRNPVAAIVEFCISKLRHWIKEVGGVRTLADLEQLVSEKLRLVFEEVWSDDDLDRIIDKYVGMGEGVFASLRDHFDDATYATLFERRKASLDSPDCYVAVIDCRGIKAARRYFTRWHEIAHLLTMTRQLELPFHRSLDDGSPIEKLMDTIAGEIGFYAPIFKPAVEAESHRHGTFSFAVVDSVREQHCPTASFQATLIACTKNVPLPVLYVEAELAFKKQEVARLRSKQLDLIPMEILKPELRATVAVPNEAAKTSDLRIHRNMRVPDDSILFSLFHAADGGPSVLETDGVESLALWKHSDGRAVGNIDVRIEARKVGDRLMAMVTPV